MYRSRHGQDGHMVTERIWLARSAISQSIRVLELIIKTGIREEKRVHRTRNYVRTENQPEGRKGRKRKYEKSGGDPYFPLLPFLPSGKLSVDSVVKKVNNRGKHFF